jgi:hypothetical protein
MFRILLKILAPCLAAGITIVLAVSMFGIAPDVSDSIVSILSTFAKLTMVCIPLGIAGSVLRTKWAITALICIVSLFLAFPIGVIASLVILGDCGMAGPNDPCFDKIPFSKQILLDSIVLAAVYGTGALALILTNVSQNRHYRQL